MSIINSEESLHLLCMLWVHQAVVTHGTDGYRIAIKNADRKVLYTTSRPRKVRGFIEAEKFMSTWANNKKAFDEEPPEIALTYTEMQAGDDDISYSIPIDLSNPVKSNENSWIFNLKFRDEVISAGKYDEVVLFIDWLPTLHIPKPIQLLLPNFFNTR